MNFPVIFDVAIGIVVIYFISSLLLSFIMEFVIVRRNWRGDFLYEKLRNLFYSSQGGLYNVIEKLYRHPLISKLQQYSYRRPETISTVNFSKTFLAVMKEIGVDTYNDQVNDFKESLKDAEIKEPIELELNKLKEKFNPAINNKELELAYLDLAMSNRKFFDGDGKRLIEGILNRNGSETNSIEQQLGEWYDAFVERTQYLFKREVKWYLFFYSLLYCAILNVDTISIYNKLLKDDKLREGVVIMANNISNMSYDSAKLVILEPIYKTIAETDSMQLDSTQQKQIKKDTVLSYKKIVLAYGDASSLIGWDKINWAELTNLVKSSNWWELFLKFLGILISAFALTYGAPFWYDYLKSMVEVRKVINPKAIKT
ncbi:MAG: hypothetical protein WBO44_10990 [Saprospiraceae bacterium]